MPYILTVPSHQQAQCWHQIWHNAFKIYYNICLYAFEWFSAYQIALFTIFDSFWWDISWMDKYVDTMMTSSMETFSALLAFCARNSPVIGEFPAKRLVTRSFNVFFGQPLNKNSWVNNRDAGDLKRHCVHYDVIVMISGKKAFLMGDHPCEEDCSLFGMLGQIYWQMPGPLDTLVKGS